MWRKERGKWVNYHQCLSFPIFPPICGEVILVDLGRKHPESIIFSSIFLSQPNTLPYHFLSTFLFPIVPAPNSPPTNCTVRLLINCLYLSITNTSFYLKLIICRTHLMILIFLCDSWSYIKFYNFKIFLKKSSSYKSFFFFFLLRIFYKSNVTFVVNKK